MADYTAIKNLITDVVKTNGEQEITGANLQNVLVSMINAVASSNNEDFDRISGSILNLLNYVDAEDEDIRNEMQELANRLDTNRYGYNVSVFGLVAGVHTLSTAVKNVPPSERFGGQKITFKTDAGWVTYQNTSLSLDNYEDVDNWALDSGVNVEGDVTITNNPDYEDLTQNDQNELKFADKEYNAATFSGLGRVYLRKNIVSSKNVLTQAMLADENTIYIIQYDYDLNNATITIPSNSVLKFEGGSFSNVGTLNVGQNCSVYNGSFTFADEGYIVLSDNCTIDNCKFAHTTYCKAGYGTIYATGKQNIVVRNCFFAEQEKNLDGDKCSSIDLRDCTDFDIYGNLVKYSEGENIIVYNGIGNIHDNRIYEGWSCIGTSRGNNDTDNSAIIISNNVCINAIAASITINTSNVHCVGNLIQFIDSEMFGPGIRLGHVHSIAANCTIEANYIENINSTVAEGADTSAGRGISLDYGDGNVIKANTIKNFVMGIGNSVSPKTCTIEANRIDGCGIGIDVYHSVQNTHTTYIKDNIITNYTSHGVSFVANKIVLLNSHIISDVANSVIFRCNNVTDIDIIGCEFNGYTFADFYYITNCKMVNCDIKLSTHTGFTRLASNSFICKDNIFDGVYLYSAPVFTFMNNVLKAASNPLYVNNSTDCCIKDNTFLLPSNVSYAIWYNNSAQLSSIKYILIDNNTTTCVGIINFDNLKNHAAGKIIPSVLGVTSRTSSTKSTYMIDGDGNIYPLAFLPTVGNVSDLGTQFERIGAQYLATSIGMEIVYSGSGGWKTTNGFTPVAAKGGFYNKPTDSLTASDEGFAYYCVDRHKVIYFSYGDGTNKTWYYADGTEATS